MSAKKEEDKSTKCAPAALWHMDGKLHLLSPRAATLPEATKIALLTIDDEQQRWCTSSYVFLGESIEDTASRLHIAIDLVKDNIIAGCRILLRTFPLAVPEDIASGSVRMVDADEKPEVVN